MENRPEILLKHAGSMTKETERQECNNSQKNSPIFCSSDVEFTAQEKGTP
jgi:hypothetical protein